MIPFNGYSLLIPTVWMTLAHLPASRRQKSPNCSAVPDHGGEPLCRERGLQFRPA
jgi:hypothetical protein